MRKREGKLTRPQAERVQDYIETFSTSAGKRVLEDLTRLYGGECYIPGDPHGTLYRAHTRDVIIWIKGRLTMGGMDIEEEE